MVSYAPLNKQRRIALEQIWHFSLLMGERTGRALLAQIKGRLIGRSSGSGEVAQKTPLFFSS